MYFKDKEENIDIDSSDVSNSIAILIEEEVTFIGKFIK